MYIENTSQNIINSPRTHKRVAAAVDQKTILVLGHFI